MALPIAPVPVPIDCSKQLIDSVYHDNTNVYQTDLLNAIGAPDLSTYCNSFGLYADKYKFIKNHNDPMDLAHLYRKYLMETPGVFLVDNKMDLVEKIIHYVDNLIVTKEGLTPQRALILNSLLPAQFSQGFDRIHSKEIKFPRDHHVQTNVSSGWYFIVGNVVSKSGHKKYAVEIIFFYQPIFPRDFLLMHGYSDCDFMVQSLFLSIFEETSPTNKVYTNNFTGLVMTNSGAAKHSRPNDKKVFFSVGSSYLESNSDNLEDLHLLVSDIDTNGNPIVVELYLTAEKPLFFQGTGRGCTPCVDGLGSLYYSYPRYKINSLKMQFNKGDPIIDDFNAKSLFWLDHQWTYGMMSAAFLSNPFMRAISNFYSSKFEGWLWFLGHLDDGRDFTFAVSCDKTMAAIPTGAAADAGATKDSSTEAKIIDSLGKTSVLYTNNKIVQKNWMTATIKNTSSPTPAKPSVNVVVPTECILTINGEDFVMKADYDFPISYNRLGGAVREGSVVIHKNDATNAPIGVGYMEMTSWFVSKDQQIDVIYGILGGALYDNRVDISNRVADTPKISLKIMSGIFIMFVVMILISLFIILPIYLLYLLVKFMKNSPSEPSNASMYSPAPSNASQ